MNVGCGVILFYLGSGMDKRALDRDKRRGHMHLDLVRELVHPHQHTLAGRLLRRQLSRRSSNGDGAAGHERTRGSRQHDRRRGPLRLLRLLLWCRLALLDHG